MRKLLIAICLLGMPCISWAQANRESWEALNSLHAGQRIEVVETSLKKHQGTFLTVSDEAIQLREGASDEPIQKENVMRVTALGHRLRNTLILAAVGGGAGAGIGAAGKHQGSLQNPNGTFIKPGQGAEIGAVIGLVGGAAIGAALSSNDTIYRAKPH